jgi:hypothetical protein
MGIPIKVMLSLIAYQRSRTPMYKTLEEVKKARDDLIAHYEQEDLIWHILSHPDQSHPRDDANATRLRAEILAWPPDNGDPDWVPHPLDQRGSSVPSGREWHFMTADDATLQTFIEGYEPDTLARLVDDKTQ